MPWSNQSGGNGGGPWKPSNNPSPWGSGGGGGGGGGRGGGGPPDLEDLLRRGQDKLKDIMPGGSIGGAGIVVLLLLAIGGWLLTGFYTVRPNEVGVNLVFGRFVGLTQPGLNYNWPYPLGSVERPAVTEVKTMEIGVRPEGPAQRRVGRPGVDESLMLTGDENIVDVDFAVQWQVSPAAPQDYVFNLRNVEGTVRAVAESVMREIVGKRNITPIMTTDRQSIENETREQMQKVLDGYKAGVLVRTVQLLKADPPAQVIDAFRDVQTARQDLDSKKNQAETYASRIVPEARGDAQRVLQGAEAYRLEKVSEAKGAASRFEQIFAEYQKAPRVTRERMLYETLERVFSRVDKVIIDGKSQGTSGVVPFLPLNDLQRRPAPPATPTPGVTR